MIVSLSWLRRYVDFDWDARELARRLTDSLTEAEVVDPPWKGVTGVVAAKVVTSGPHPDADKLSVCVVDYGSGSSTVVCGAPNVRAGMTSVLAVPGAVVAHGHAINEQSIRGRRSYGMLVSAQELGLEESSEGILELPDSVEAGADVRDMLGLDDEIIDLDAQPNRPDCLGMIGVAREIAAIAGTALRRPDFELEEDGPPSAELCAVDIEDPAGCPRYIARVVSDVKIGPSPLWLQSALRSVGVRSISNIVDITNFVMLEYGHPIHAFDYDRVADHRIVVRRARPGEVLVTLDDVERTLTEEHLLICDGREPVALAGIMGGGDSEVTDGTSNILLECAWFDPVVVRRGAGKLGIRTEASQRFERGVDPEAMEAVAGRACSLMAQLAGGRVAPGAVDAGSEGPRARNVTLRLDRVKSMLGRDVRRDDIVACLTPLEFSVEDGSNESALVIGVPSHRPDIEVEADLIEEIIREDGFEKIPAEVPFHSLDAPPDEGIDARNGVRNAMVRLGFYEILTSSFMSEGAIGPLGGFAVWGEPIVLANPVNKEMPLLRTALLPAILDVVRRNRNVGEKDLRLFEIGKVFRKEAGGHSERWVLAGALAGASARHSWDEKARGVDFYDLKGVLAGLAEALDIDTPEASCYDGPTLEEGLGALLSAGEAKLGIFGQLSKKALSAWEFDEPVFVFELDLDALTGLVPETAAYEELTRYPKSRRDVALVVDETVAAGDVIAEVESLEVALLTGVEVFDIYRGDQLPAGKKSLGLALTYMSRERTLTDEEVDGAHKAIVERLETRFAATLR